MCLDEKEELFYTFNYKGFRVEKPRGKSVLKKRRNGSVCIRLQVTENTYKSIQNQLDYFENNKEKYTYSKLGVILCIIKVRHKFHKSYFCSQFVAEMLSSSKAVKLKKDSSLYLPNDLMKELKSMQRQRKMLYNII